MQQVDSSTAREPGDRPGTFSPVDAVGVGLAVRQPSPLHIAPPGIASRHRVTRAGVREFSVKSRLWLLAGALALACMSVRARAAADAAAYAAVGNGAPSEVVITATRTATPVDELAVPVIVITRSDIEHALASDVGELLTGLSGVEIARNGGSGQPASLFLRGTNSDQTTVLVDGVRINPGTSGGAQIMNIQPESIERIEIVKGARSSLYGTDAIGGVINIITRAGAAPGASLYAADGHYGTRVFAGDASGPLTDRLGAGGSFVYQRSDGFPPLQGVSDPGDYRNRSANALLHYAVSDSLTLRAQLWRADGKSAYSEFGPVSEDFQNASYAAGADWRDTAGRSARLTVSRVTDNVNQRQVTDFDHTSRDALDAQFSWRLWNVHELTLGAVTANEHTQSLSFGLPFDVHTHTVLAFAQDQLRSGANDLLLALGHTHHETFGEHTTWNAEYGRELLTGLRATVALGTAFHAPGSSDLYGYGGNPALHPEVSRQGELGLRWQPTGGQQLRLAAFENRVDELIDFVLVDPVNFLYQAENVERARIRGAEAEYEWRTTAWRVHAAYSLQDPRDLTTGGQLLRRARHNLALGLQYDAGRINASADLQLAGARLDYGFVAPVQLGGYALLNLGVGYPLSPGWSLQARVDNALDKRYELASGYNTARRGLTLAMRYHMR